MGNPLPAITICVETMPDPDGQILNRDLADDIINGRLIGSTGLAIPDAPIHASNFRAGPSTGPLGSSGVEATLIQQRVVRFYTGDPAEDGAGLVFATVTGSSALSTGRRLLTSIEAPGLGETAPAGAMSLTLFSESVDDTKAPEFRVFYNGGSANTPKANFSNMNMTCDHVFATTNAGAANVVVTSTGGLRRNASALQYKTGWSYTTNLADRQLPAPITWPTDTGGTRIGYGAEHVAAYLPEAAAHEQYHLAGIVAVLQDKVKRLEEANGLDST